MSFIDEFLIQTARTQIWLIVQCGLQGHLKWEVNFIDFVNIPIFGQFNHNQFNNQVLLSYINISLKTGPKIGIGPK